jgi:Tfp pilus assembly major pilin PilA
MIIIGLTVVSVVIAVVLGLGLYQEYVAKPASPVAVVNGVPVRTDTLPMKALRCWLNTFSRLLMKPRDR